MALTKIVNGKVVQLTAEQEAAVRADWDLAKARSAIEAEAIVQQATDKASAVSKLEELGLSSSEIDALTK